MSESSSFPSPFFTDFSASAFSLAGLAVSDPAVPAFSAPDFSDFVFSDPFFSNPELSDPVFSDPELSDPDSADPFFSVCVPAPPQAVSIAADMIRIIIIKRIFILFQKRPFPAVMSETSFPKNVRICRCYLSHDVPAINLAGQCLERRFCESSL